MKRSLLLLLLLLAAANSIGQYYTNENKVWVFGRYAGLNFTSGTPVPFAASSIATPEGSASVSDATGTLLFYTDGTSIWRASGTLMANVIPASYSAASMSQSALIVPRINTPGQYYVFSIAEAFGGATISLWYCIVDMSLSGGTGNIVPGTITTTPFATGLCEKITAIAGNACDIWVVVHSFNVAEFRAYEITSTGVNPTPVLSSVGTLSGSTFGGLYDVGCIAASPDRTKIALGTWDSPYGLTSRGLELYDFDPNTGIVSNCRVLDNTASTYGVEFSPDNTKLYSTDVAIVTPPAAVSGRLSQYDVTLPTAAAIAASRYIVVPPTPPTTPASNPTLKLGPDGKIYLPSMVPVSSGYLDLISNPNLAGAACGYIPHAITLPPGPPPSQGQLGLPNIVVALVSNDTDYYAHDTSLCLSHAILKPSISGTNYLWSTGATIDSAIITTSGTYWVRVVNGCQLVVDTFHVSVLSPDSRPSIIGDTLYCYGDTFTPFTVTGTGIKWYTGSSTTGSTIPPTVNTSVPGTYKFYATQTITCESARDSITVTVLPRISPAFTYTVDIECPTATVHFTNTTTNATSYIWNFGDGSATTTIADPVHSYSAFGTYNVKLTALTPQCTRDTTISIIVDNLLQVAISASPDTICVGGSTLLSTIVTSVGTVASYSWQFGDGSAPGTAAMETHTYTTGGVYPVSVLVTDVSGCKDSAYTSIVVLQPWVSVTVPDTVLCIGQPLQLSCSTSVNIPVDTIFSYSWSPTTYLNNASTGSPVYLARGTGGITYTVVATLQPWGCVTTDTVHIASIRATPLTGVTPGVTIKYGESIQLDARGSLFYLWKPNDGTLNNNNINNPIASPFATTVYTVYGYDTRGCLDSAQVTIAVDSSADECLPLAFTPNGDGLNDLFRPLCITYQKIVEFSIYNRWGERVFYTTKTGDGWNGTYKNLPAELGVYFYMLIIDRLGEHIVYKGDVTLVR